MHTWRKTSRMRNVSVFRKVGRNGRNQLNCRNENERICFWQIVPHHKWFLQMVRRRRNEVRIRFVATGYQMALCNDSRRAFLNWHADCNKRFVREAQKAEWMARIENPPSRPRRRVAILDPAGSPNRFHGLPRPHNRDATTPLASQLSLVNIPPPPASPGGWFHFFIQFTSPEALHHRPV
jgi:hypothetical protein